jgi:hypothetical protein
MDKKTDKINCHIFVCEATTPVHAIHQQLFLSNSSLPRILFASSLLASAMLAISLC